MADKLILNNTQVKVLDALECSINGTAPSFSSTENWDDIFNESLCHSVYGIVYSVIKNNTDIVFDGKWETLYYRVLSNNLRNISAHQLVNKILSEKGIEYVVLKGVASSHYYPNPDLRMMGDIDFIVPESSYKDAESALIEYGFVEKDHIEHSFHSNYIYNGNEFELHWSFPGVPEGGDIREKSKELLQDIYKKKIYYNNCSVPSLFHHGLVLLLHSAEHITATGIGLRHLYDWAVFVARISDDDFRVTFERPLKEIGLWKLAKVLTKISVVYLGVEKKEWAEDIDDCLADRLLMDIVESGNFGRKDEQRMNQFKLFLNANSGQVSLNDSMTKNLFAYLSLKARLAMPIVEKHRILMPIGWIYVGVRHIFRIRKGKRYKIKLKETMSGAKKRRELYSELDLFECKC